MLEKKNGRIVIGEGDREDERHEFQSKGKHFRKEGRC
jgi:hypothetical protein